MGDIGEETALSVAVTLAVAGYPQNHSGVCSYCTDRKSLTIMQSINSKTFFLVSYANCVVTHFLKGLKALNLE